MWSDTDTITDAPITISGNNSTFTGQVQARRPRSNTVGDVALSIQPSDSTIHYGFRIDQATNSLNLDRVGTGNFLTIDGSGNVAIGTDSPNVYSNQTTLTINGSSYGRLDLESGGTIRSSLFSTTANTTLDVQSGFFSIDVGGSERMRLDSSGNLGLATTSASSFNQLTSQGTAPVLVVGGGTGNPSISIFSANNNVCLLYTSPSPRDLSTSRMPSSA